MLAKLKGKKLLMLGGASYTSYVKQYADQVGFELFAAGGIINKEMQKYTKAFYLAEATDPIQICQLIKEYNIDGVVALGNENIIDTTINIAEKMKIPFYLERKHWSELQDKKKFKEHCCEFGIDVVPEQYITDGVTENQLKALSYPIVLKPTDSCGSKGITICYSDLEVRRAIEKALQYSKSKTFLVEKYMQCPEFIVSYIFIDGEIYVWMLGDRYMNTSQRGYGSLSNLSVYPSRYSDLYFQNVHSKMLQMLKKYGPSNGTMFIQAFVDEEKIRFFDPGLRFCGTIDTILYEHVCQVNPLHWMINHSLTGKMCEQDGINKLDWKLHGKTCGQLSILVKPGIIKRIQGIEKIKKIPGVINVLQLLFVGDIVDMVGTLQQVLLRVHIVQNTKEEIDQMAKQIYREIMVEDENGDDMKLSYCSTDENSELEGDSFENFKNSGLL